MSETVQLFDSIDDFLEYFNANLLKKGNCVTEMSEDQLSIVYVLIGENDCEVRLLSYKGSVLIKDYERDEMIESVEFANDKLAKVLNVPLVIDSGDLIIVKEDCQLQ
ncbi:hypothetical protein [Ammoniphilus sp. 3BR4]|uniref:hypothetical protein n=1 Tax=Ammoniphilus sp. 3BR4 TaxID=3158265 RepID=UPI00346761C8